MAWFRLDDNFHSHPKVLSAGNAAVGLWVRCCTYSAQHLLNGKVPEHIALLYGSAELAQEVTDAGLWQRVEGGYKVRDFLRYNPSKKQVEKERKEAAERQRLSRERRKAAAAARAAKQALDLQEQTEPVTDMSRCDKGVSHGPVTAPRPDPTRPELPTEVLLSSHLGMGGPGGTREPRAKRLPEDWQPTDRDVAWAREQGIPDTLARWETEKFRDWCHAVGKAYVDPSKAWKNWLRRASESPTRGALVPVNGNGAKPSTTDQRVAAAWALGDTYTDAEGGAA